MPPPVLASLQAPSTGATGDWRTVPTGDSGLAALGKTVVSPRSHLLHTTFGTEGVQVPWSTFGRTAAQGETPRSFDDVFTFIGGTSAAASTVSAHDIGANMRPTSAGQPSVLLGGLGSGADLTSHTLIWPLSPEEPLSVVELNFIMRALQGLVGEFQQLELGGVAGRPEQLRQ